MNTRIKTNRIEYSLDRDLISKQYDFFTIETSEKYIKRGAYILDVPTLEDNVKSIRFESGRRAIVMMACNEANRSLLKEAIGRSEGGDRLSVATCHFSEIEDYVLLQLLLNALSAYNSKYLKFNNLTGHLYCFHPDWIKRGKEKSEDVIWKVPCLELSICSDFVLKTVVRTFTSERLKKKMVFTRKKFEDYPKYIFSNRNTLRRKLAEDLEPAFILRQVEGTKTEIPFLDIQNIDKFERCKVGVVNRVIESFNAHYSEFAHIALGYEEVADRIDYSKVAAKENDKIVSTQLCEHGINVVDQIGDAYSAEYCKSILELLARKYGIEARTGKRINPDALNICVIHNAAYYDGIEDPHDKKYDNAAIQHITFEDFAESSEFAISTVVHEVIVKNDLKSGKITLFDWTKLGFTEDISFGVEEEIDGVNRYFFICIHPDGSFSVSEQELNLFEMNEYSDCVNIFEDARTNGETVKGIIKDSSGNINVIKDTGLLTYPEAEAIKNLLADGDTKLRGKERREQLLSSCLDIKMFKKDNVQFYFVGTIGEGMRWNIPRAANIRKIEGYDGALVMFERLLPLMNVTFVHNGQLTVLPFPFKYLREYVIQNKRD